MAAYIVAFIIAMIIIAVAFFRFLLYVYDCTLKLYPFLIAFILLICAGVMAFVFMRKFMAEKICLSKEGIDSVDREGIIQHFNWEDVSKIIRSRYMGLKTLVFISQAGDSIWFCENKKTLSCIFEMRPQLQNLLVEERQPWEHQSPKKEKSNMKHFLSFSIIIAAISVVVIFYVMVMWIPTNPIMREAQSVMSGEKLLTAEDPLWRYSYREEMYPDTAKIEYDVGRLFVYHDQNSGYIIILYSIRYTKADGEIGCFSNAMARWNIEKIDSQWVITEVIEAP